ncbi:hypothetical protein SLS57_000750 [Botryosphaeria dothidea]
MDSQSLRKAAEDGESDEVKALLGSHASFSDLELANALSSAARAGHSEVLGLLLSHGIPINEQAFLGACTAEEPAVFEQFIDHGWDINSTEFGHTALSLVVSSYACTKFLLEKGADPNLGREGGASPLAIAAFKPSAEVLDLILSFGAKMDPQALFNAIQLRGGGGIPVMKLLIERGADVNARIKGKATPLHWAVRSGDKERIQLLLENGADKTNNSFAGRTPADLALEQGKTGIYEMLCG